MTDRILEPEVIKSALERALMLARQNTAGSVASYIPELESVDNDLVGVVLKLTGGKTFVSGDMFEDKMTLQSTAKLVVLIGLLEEFGPKAVQSWVRVEPSGDDFASIARLDQFGPVPSNPMLNAGAITLCSHVPGNLEERLGWLEKWMTILFGEDLRLNSKVFASERRTGDRNRSLAYLLQSNGILSGPLDDTLETYFALCSYEVDLKQAVHLPALLANNGCSYDGTQVLSLDTVCRVVAIMATCGLYNETGTHLVRTGIPAKSGVSGLILGSALGYGGIAVASPRVNKRGTSVRGSMILEYLAQELNLHFAMNR